jgi:hypothetical protein
MRKYQVILFTLLLTFATVAAGADLGPEPRSQDAVLLVQDFYDRYPNEMEGGFPEGEDLAWIRRFITERLYGRFRSVLEYQQDWIKRNSDHPPYYLKPPFAEGIHFTGVPDAVEAFKIVESEPQTPRTCFVRVRFWIELGGYGWEALVVVQQERSRYAIDDIIFLPSEPGEKEWCLSETLERREPE